VDALKAAQEELIQTWHEYQRMLEAQRPNMSDSQRRRVNDQGIILNDRLCMAEQAFHSCVHACSVCENPDVLTDLLRCASPFRSVDALLLTTAN
jgi:hypothetical protein